VWISHTDVDLGVTLSWRATAGVPSRLLDGLVCFGPLAALCTLCGLWPERIVGVSDVLLYAVPRDLANSVFPSPTCAWAVGTVAEGVSDPLARGADLALDELVASRRHHVRGVNQRAFECVTLVAQAFDVAGLVSEAGAAESNGVELSLGGL
jgi:hypothetical protein